MSIVSERLSESAASGLTFDELLSAWNQVVDSLRGEQLPSGHWTGQLSTSALSTATAISAMAVTMQRNCVAEAQRLQVKQAIAGGCDWLKGHQNEDGGFGDTDRSHSNIATTLLVLAAWELAAKLDGEPGVADQQRQAAWQYVHAQGSWDGLRRRYGKDKTFVVPILSNCALAGLVPWSEVSPLPFEAAALPQDWYRWARMPVVSYAIPALVAIGQSRFHKSPPRNVLLRKLRQAAVQPTLNVLRRMQPASGGYLEAVPLTSFVLMNLAAVGHGGLPVAIDCLRFILDSRLSDGSWTIDTNLATWATSLSIHGLSRRGRLTLHTAGKFEAGRSDSPASQPATSVSTQTIRWLLSCQHRQKHPFTGANPGGWGWTDLSGAVPDADDTPAALLALRSIDVDAPPWQRLKDQIETAGQSGVAWLLNLQNRDGGWPTFCKGWGTLPFDRSGTDLTAHAIRALDAWKNSVPKQVESRIERAVARGFRYLERRQLSDGSWLPLWFGNQDRAEEDNPAYGTGKVLLAYAALGRQALSVAERGQEYLRSSQNEDGGWGGGASVRRMRESERWESTSTVEETAVAIEALLECGGHPLSDATIMHGLCWLADAIHRGGTERAMPIGFYFAKLWYYERMYPYVFSVSALGSALRKLEHEQAVCAQHEP